MPGCALGQSFDILRLDLLLELDSLFQWRNSQNYVSPEGQDRSLRRCSMRRCREGFRMRARNMGRNLCGERLRFAKGDTRQDSFRYWDAANLVRDRYTVGHIELELRVFGHRRLHRSLNGGREFAQGNGYRLRHRFSFQGKIGRELRQRMQQRSRVVAGICTASRRERVVPYNKYRAVSMMSNAEQPGRWR